MILVVSALGCDQGGGGGGGGGSAATPVKQAGAGFSADLAKKLDTGSDSTRTNANTGKTEGSDSDSKPAAAGSDDSKAGSADTKTAGDSKAGSADTKTGDTKTGSAAAGDSKAGNADTKTSGDTKAGSARKPGDTKTGSADTKVAAAGSASKSGDTKTGSADTKVAAAGSASPPKIDPPKIDPPKVDPPKVDPPKVDPPKAGSATAPKANSSVIISSGTTPKASVTVPAELKAITISLLPNWDRDVEAAGTFSLAVKIPGRTETATFIFQYGYEDPKAPADRDAYKKWLAEHKIFNSRDDRQKGGAWYLEGVDGSGKPAFRMVVQYGGKKLICYGSLYKDSTLGDLRDQTVIQAKQICETIAL